MFPGELSLRFHAHRLGDARGSCLTAVTDGLHRHDQREMALTIRASDAGDLRSHMREAVDLFARIYRLVRQGRLMRSGGFTQFRGRGPFGRDDGGVIYVDARSLPDVDLPDDALTLLLVDEVEARVVVACGPYRILSRLARHAGVYPFPIWNDLARPSVARAGRESESLLAKVPRARIPGIAFIVEEDRVRVLIAPCAREDLDKMVSDLNDTDAVALLTEPAPDADARLVWCPGQGRPEAIAPPHTNGTRVTGSFLALVPDSVRDEVRLFEDGYAALLSARSWRSFRDALGSKRRFVLRCEDSPILEIVWLDEAYVNPVDGETYVSPHGWRQRDPHTCGSLAHERVVLLSPEDDVLAALEPDALAAYIKTISTHVASIPESTRAPRHTLYVQCELDPELPPRIVVKCVPAGLTPANAVTCLAGLHAPRVRRKVVFQVMVDRGSDA